MKKRIMGLLLASFLFSASASASDLYSVKAGDTLSALSSEFNVTVEQLMQTNGLKTDRLSIGQELSIPGSNDGSSQRKKLAKVLPDKLNLRDQPETKGEVLSVLSRDTLVEVIEEGDQWSKVKAGEQVGFLASEFLAFPQDNTSRSLNLILNKVKVLSTSLVGTPYRSGGTSLAGFDCSGFTSYVMSQFGVKLPRVSSEQFLVGSKVDRKDLRVGDLVFFDTLKKGRISHVGIYIGNNKMVHSAARKVEVSELNWYFKNYKYYGAKRILDL